MTYDVIIAGASFAGLSVAGQISGRVLVIDKQDIGLGQTSACATFLAVAERLNCLDSVLQEHRDIYIHTVTRSLCLRLPEPICTFDYAPFCRQLADQSDFDWLRAKVIGVSGEEVITDKGSFRATCLVDASGWRAALALADAPPDEYINNTSVGIEYNGQFEGEGLHFSFDPRVVAKGYGWVFPAGKTSRVGVGSYTPNRRLKSCLDKFSGQREATRGIHGGRFPSGLRPAAAKNLFIVGDAAGHCLPVTGEGIRTAVYFGEACGRIVQKVISKEMNLDEGLAEYGAFVERHQRAFLRMRRLQKWFELVPNALLTQTAVWAERNFERVMRGYTRVADPTSLTGPISRRPRSQAVRKS